jgi:pimeloyl-ACP methyl ester carboxylesterase
MEYLTRADGVKLAYHYRRGSGPTLVFLPGYQSDMAGSKAIKLDEWAGARGAAMLRLDYSGCGQSGGRFEDGTLNVWRDDAMLLIRELIDGPVVLIGSSMGGWLALLMARALGEQVVALVGIAAAPDFTTWGFSDAEVAILQSEGRLIYTSDYCPEPRVTTQGFWQSGQHNLMLGEAIEITCPVRLIQGQQDDVVPWDIAVKTSALLRSDDVQTILVKDGDHRLSRPQDIALLLRTVESLLETI